MQPNSLVHAGVVLGIGLGGFLDGIVFHQLLQVHSMLSARVPRDTVIGLEVNMLWDGLFHLFTWIITVWGIVLLWRAFKSGRQCGRTFVGSILMGWGLFNVVEGILNHHILHLHHVTESSEHLFFDILFLATGLLLVAFGTWLMRSVDSNRS